MSNSSLVQSMIVNDRLAMRVERIQSRKRKHIIEKPINSVPAVTLHSDDCSSINVHQVQSTFHWSHRIEISSSIELVYHLDSTELQKSSVPIRLSLKQSQTLVELFSLNTHLQIDRVRDLYFLDIHNYLLKINMQNFIIETSIGNHTCQTSSAYILISSVKSNSVSSYDLQQRTLCQLRTIHVDFGELGLAYFIIRPKHYTFTYCDGSCSNLTFRQQFQHYALYALVKSLVAKTQANVPRAACVPSEFSNDNFLLRQTDGTIQIYPIKDVIVKRCSCL